MKLKVLDVVEWTSRCLSLNTRGELWVKISIQIRQVYALQRALWYQAEFTHTVSYSIQIIKGPFHFNHPNLVLPLKTNKHI